MKLFIIIITIACFSLTGSFGSSVDYPNDILTKPKDDCGNICGQMNANISNNKCGDPDKRNHSILLVHEQHDQKEEKTEYYDPMIFECVEKCSDSLQLYTNSNNNKFCVKNAIQFGLETVKSQIKVDEDVKIAEKDNKKQSDDTIVKKQQHDTTAKKEQHDDISSYTWWIAGGIGILIIAVIAVVVGVYLKKRSSDNVDLEPPSRPIQML